MNITLNGQAKELSDTQNLKEIVAQFCRNKTPVIAELNGEIVKNPQWENAVVKEGDTVELISFVGGGCSGDNPLTIAGKAFTSRFMLGTGKFKNKSDVTQSIMASGAEIVMVSSLVPPY